MSRGTLEETPSGEQSDAPSMTDRLSRRGPDIDAEVARDYGRDYKTALSRAKEKRLANFSANRLFCLARPERFELPTTWFVARYSIQLSYGRL